jgi:hypothetical protein
VQVQHDEGRVARTTRRGRPLDGDAAELVPLERHAVGLDDQRGEELLLRGDLLGQLR